MKKLKTLILFLIFFIPFIANAQTKIEMSVPTVVNPGQEIYVDITANASESIDQYKMSFTYESSNLELLNIEARDNWNMDSGFTLSSPLNMTFNHVGIAGKTTIARLKFKVKINYEKTSTNLAAESVVKNKDTQTIVNLERVTKKIDIKSTDNSLKDLKLNNETIINFAPNNFTYRLTLPADTSTVSFTAVLNDSTASFKKGFEPKKDLELKYGDNSFEIVVVAAAGAEKKYVINIHREDNRGNNNNLKSLVINANPKLLEFNKNTLEYNIKTHKLTDLEVTCVPEDPKAKVEVIKPEKIIIGKNEVVIKVTSENNLEKIYKVMIDNVDTEIDTTLKNIRIFGLSGEEFKFELGKYDYELRYNKKYNSNLVVKVEYNNSDEAELDNGTLANDIFNLKANGKIRIIIRAKDGTKDVDSIYTITFKSDERLNFYLLLSGVIFIALLGVLIKLYLDIKKTKIKIKQTEEELEKTKRIDVQNTK